MKTKCLLYSLFFLCSIRLSYSQNKNTEVETGNLPLVQPSNTESDENSPPQQTPENEEIQLSPNPNQEPTSSEQNNQLPDKVQKYLLGYEDFVKKHGKEVEKEENINGNLHCIKTLLSTIHYPILYDSPEHYYSTVCNENTNIEALKYLQSIIDKPDICKENGNNYQTAYKMLRARHYLNCMKDMNTNKYCYETNTDFYIKLLQDEMNNQNTNNANQNKKNNYKSSFLHMCNENQNINEIPFCSKMAIIGNSIADKLVTENVTLEIYYSNNQTYKLELQTSDNNGDSLSKDIEKQCRPKEVYNSLKNINNLDTPAKEILNLYNGGLSLHLNLINILSITLITSIFFMFM